jgi:prepilin-type processing-associated H-X9-DG protein
MPWVGDHAEWPVRLWELLGRNRDVFHCPARPVEYSWPAADARPFYYGHGDVPFFETFGGSVPFSYAYNIGGYDGMYFDRGIGGTHRGLKGGTNFWQYTELRASRVKVAAQMIAIADGPDMHGPPFVPDCFALVPVTGGISLRLYTPSGPHRRRLINVLFCDGHVETLSHRELVGEIGHSPGTAQRQRWNRDNLP